MALSLNRGASQTHRLNKSNDAVEQVVAADAGEPPSLFPIAFGLARLRSSFALNLLIAVKSYLIDGNEARGEDYVGAIDALPSDDLAFFRVRVPDKGTVMVSTYPGGFIVTDERLDGSSRTSSVLAKERVKGLLGLFLNGDDAWREGLEWELTTLTTRDAWRRTLRLVLIGAIGVALAAWLVRLFTK